MPTSHIRALNTFDQLPDGHATFLMNSDGHAPHINIGEFAVIDTTDRKLQHGELYLMQNSSARRERSIVQTKIWPDVHFVDIDGTPSEEPVWATQQLRGFRKVGKFDGMPLFAGMCGGHYRAAWLEKQLIGRVVGVSDSPLGKLLDPAAGYVDEDAANQAFDEREFVDMLIAVGCEPRVRRGRNGRWGLWQSQGRCHDQYSRKQEMALREKEAAASTGIDRVIAECIRRGLID